MVYLTNWKPIYHLGHFAFITLVALWLTRTCTRAEVPTRHPRSVLRPQSAVLTLFLLLHAGMGLQAYGGDVTVPLSAGKAVAVFLKTHQLDRLPLFACRDNMGASIAGYLDRPLYYPEQQRLGTFIVWPYRTRFPKGEAVLQEAQAFVAQQPSDTICIFSAGMEPPQIPPSWELLGRFDNASMQSERYQVFRCPRIQAGD